MPSPTRRRPFTPLLLPALLATLLLTPPSARAFYFRLSGDRLWLAASNAPLTQILGEFARLGVRVRISPNINPSVTASFHARPLDEALPRILSGCDYLLTWTRLPGPLSPIPKLHEIAVFPPGVPPSSLPPLPQPLAPFAVTRGPSPASPEFVPDELLLGPSPKTTPDQFQRLLDNISGMIAAVDPKTGLYLIRFPTGTNVESLLDPLRQNPLLSFAELNAVLRLDPLPPSPLPHNATPIPLPPNTTPIPLPPNTTPAPPLLAVLDTGFDPASPFATITTGALDATHPGAPISDPNGHGTQIALLASGLFTADGLQPASPNALQPVLPVKTFDSHGVTSAFTLLRALAYAADSGARVVNMSWTTSTDSPPLRTAVSQAIASGLILVAAAGNYASSSPRYPAAYPGVIAVAATQNNQPWPLSNHGPTIDVAATATATIPRHHHNPPSLLAGTSISSAVVANAIARYYALHPSATPAQALAALANALSPPLRNDYGLGTLDANALSRFLQTNCPPSPPPKLGKGHCPSPLGPLLSPP